MLALSNDGDWVLDPFVGTGTTIIAAIRHGRRGAGAEIVPADLEIARQRIGQQLEGTLRTGPMNRPVYDPAHAGKRLTAPPAPDQQGSLPVFGGN